MDKKKFTKAPNLEILDNITSFDELKNLPSEKGVYIVFNYDLDESYYVGLSQVSIKSRWGNHHRYKQLKKYASKRKIKLQIGCIFLKEKEKIIETEKHFIENLNPLLQFKCPRKIHERNKGSVIRIPYQTVEAIKHEGFGIVILQNTIVGIIEPLQSNISFKRGDNEDEIRKVYLENIGSEDG